MKKELLKIQDLEHELTELRSYVRCLEETHMRVLDLKNFYKQQYECYYDLYFKNIPMEDKQ